MTNAEVVAGVQTVITWALHPTTRLNTAIVPSELRGLAIGAFAFSYIYYSNGKIATSNIIPSALLYGGATATKCPLQTAVQCGANYGVYSWAPQLFDYTTTCSTVTSCDAQSMITTTATRTFAAGSILTSSPSGGKGQQVAMASYINPLANPAA
ncbi:hypothetical protein N7517_001010 [Penicillium concentricum]|uniref:Uncharacterized protein n=1 Tax=Penicillium concentricum TaxID=293559 RepID=A0A9W9SSP3_9EURO|nr:uncharacterized protein N7517_001010 [Penicillium concentricum]KAJ5383099.1 hypothetical protein N7517_001010 [Penicillium concentricum]